MNSPHSFSPGRAVAFVGLLMAFQAGWGIVIVGGELILGLFLPGLEFSLLRSPVWLGMGNLAAALCVIEVERRWKGSVWPSITPTPPLVSIPRVLMPALVVGSGILILSINFTALLLEVTQSLPWTPYFEVSFLDLGKHPWGAPFLALVIAPLTEEVICRHLILGGLLLTVPPRKAILISALLFSGLHLNLWQVPVTLTIGLFFGWVFYRTRSLLLCILLHAFHNAGAILYHTYENSRDPVMEALNGHEPLWFNQWPAVPVALGIVGAGIIWFRREVPPPPLFKLPSPPPKHVPRPPPLPASVPPPPEDSPFQHSTIQRSRRMSDELATLVTSIAKRARAASHVLATVPTAQKNAALEKLAELIPAAAESLQVANQKDLDAAAANGLTSAQIDRLTLTPDRLEQLAESVRQVALLPDPIGATLETTTRPNGLVIEKRRVPIGVIGIIYEARPNVTVDCAILCLKSGNAAILRGGKEIFHTNTALASLIAEALSSAGLPADAVQLIPTTDRAALNTMLKLDELIHCIIPRGGEGLIRFVAQNSTIPVIKHYTGVCFVHLDKAADPALAEAVTVNAKTQRPGVCNAAEQLLVDAAVAESLLPRVGGGLHQAGVELRVDARSAAILSAADIPHVAATEEDFKAEFLGPIMAVRVVDSLEEAITTINATSSGHSETIITTDAEAAGRFQAAIDSSAVFWNASTRFNDGFEFGFGAEIGISTDRLHARGPMGLPELCSYKYVVTGTGQIRT